MQNRFIFKSDLYTFSTIVLHVFNTLDNGAVGSSVRIACGRFDVWIFAGADLSRRNNRLCMPDPLLNNLQQMLMPRVLEYYRKNKLHVKPYVLHVNDLSQIGFGNTLLCISKQCMGNHCVVICPRQRSNGLERSPSKRKVGFSNPSPDRPESFKQTGTAPHLTLGNSCPQDEIVSLRPA